MSNGICLRAWPQFRRSVCVLVKTRSAYLALCIGPVLFWPSSALAHENHEPSASIHSSVAVFNELEPEEPGNLARKRSAANEASLDTPHLLGQWSEVDQWPLLAVHATLLPTGDVLAWDATPDDFDDNPHTTNNYTTRVTVWDPVTNTHLAANNDTNADLFCAGSAQLWDGRVVFAGGDSGKQGRNGPLSNSSIYDPWTNTWRQTDNLNAPRWYSSNAALSNGELLTFGGTYSPTPLAEVLQFNKQWRPLPLETQYTISGDYSWLQTTSNGDVMYLGPHNTLSTLETAGEGLWSAGPERDDIPYRSYGSYAMYSENNVIVAGGAESTNSATVVDLLTQISEPAADMVIGRRQHNLTVLADGSVLATGGNSSGVSLVDLDNSVLTPEVWNPDTDEWTVLADMQRARQYHSIALLLPDGRVLSAGGGYCGECGTAGYHEQNAEIFSPPYLFDENGAAVRPTITEAPSKIDYDQVISVRTPDSADISSVSLIKLGSVTHSQNQEQRFKALPFRTRKNLLRVRTPVTREISPPGHYLLFLINKQGTPSLGKVIQVGQPLIQSDDVVVNTLNPEKWEHYEIEGNGEHTLTVALQGNIHDIDLVVGVGQSPTDVEVDNGFDECISTEAVPQRTICVVAATESTTWYLGIKGQDYERYSVIANINENRSIARRPVEPGSNRAPEIPGNLQGTTSAFDQIALSWEEANDADAVVGYEVWRDGELHAFVHTANYQEQQLQPETSYIYQVVAVDKLQNRSSISLPLQIDTLANPVDNLDSFYHPEVPTAPTNLRYIEYSDTTVELFWQPSFDNGAITAYEVYRNGELVHSGRGVSYLEDSIVSDGNYTYNVVAVDDDDNRSFPSNEISINPRSGTAESSIKDGTSDIVDVDGVNSALLAGPQTDIKSGAALWILFLTTLLCSHRFFSVPRRISTWCKYPVCYVRF